MDLEKRIDRILGLWRALILVGLILSIGISLSIQDYLGAVLSVPMMSGTYFVGVYILGQYFKLSSPKAEIIATLHGMKIREINERLADGTLTAGTKELDELMIAAGLQPLMSIESFGPPVGKLGEVPLYDWLEMKRGADGEPQRYSFIGQAQYDADGVMRVPNENDLYLVLDGVLYEHKVSVEPKKI